MSKLNEKLRILMTNQGWSQKRLAERMFVSPDTVSSWVRGINHPTLETVKELCEIFCIPIEELTNDNIDVPEYEEVERKLPYPICCYPEDQQDTEHIIIDAALANEGQGVAKDEHRAFIWYKQAAEQGNATAKYEIAERYELGIGTRKNKEKALEWYLKAAEHGNINAKNKAMDLSRYDPSTEAKIFNKMGVDYLAGKNRKPQDKEMAIYCFKRAIELGSKKAEENLRKAAENGIIEIGIVQDIMDVTKQNDNNNGKDEEKAFEWYKKSAEQGYKESQFKLAECYEKGVGTEIGAQKSFEWYKKVAEQGDTEAQAKIAKCYEEGTGTEKDEGMALCWLYKAAEQGFAEAQYEIAKCYAEGHGIEKNEQKAFEWYLKAAEQGFAEAKHEIAKCYAEGHGIEKDVQKAFEWYLKAAEEGIAEAQYKIASFYQVGIGVVKNEGKACWWYYQAAEQGNATAQYELALCYAKGYGRAQSNLAECYRWGYGVEEDVKEADYWLEKNAIKDDYNIEWYKKVAAQGYRNAQYHLALWYMNEDSPENENEVVELFRKAANQGLTDAQLQLADCYEYGDSVEADTQKAFEWLKKAAEQGHVNAQLRLADCYECGNGIKANEQKAFEWYKKAAEQGDCNAQLNLGRFFARGLGTEKNAQKAFEWFKKAAEQGYARAQYDLAIRYENGDGVEADEQKALEWYKKAAEQGDALSQNNLGRFYELKCNDKEAIKWYRKAAKHGYGNAEIALRRFGADKNYSIVVIGEFSTGKSAFINALAGKAILPSSKNPSTVVVTEVTYSESPAYVIHYRNGNVINVSEEEFMSIRVQCSFDLKPNDYDKIKYVEVGYPATFFKNGLKVIDTPGSDNISRTCLKFNEPYLRIADAVVLMMSVFSPLTTREKEFLVDYSRNYGIDNLFLVVSHKDEFENSDEENCVRQNILNRLSDLGDFSNRLFMVSIKQALLYRRKELGEMLRPKMLQELPDTIEETGLTIFEKELISYIDTYR